MIKRLFSRLFGSRQAHQMAPVVKPSHRRHPVLLHASQHGIDPRAVSPSAVRVVSELQKAGYQAFVVGGAVRDLLLHQKPKDFDVATNAEPEQVQKLFRRARIIGRRFQIVHVMFGPETIEVSTFRALQGDSAPTDEHGRVLRDNVFGEQHEDAARRDFTINALYYDPVSQTVLDYHDGVADLKSKVLRMIGEPRVRYREDPVRMLRVVRFAAKLDFSIDAATREPVAEMAPLIENVPAARLFDEMLKLLQSGRAMACLRQLRELGLHHGMLPLLDVVLEQGQGERFVSLALDKTDARVRSGKTISPGFLFAALLWNLVRENWMARKARGEVQIPALYDAMDDVLEQQTEKLAIQRRFVADMKEIWSLQPRFEKRSGKSPFRLLEHLRFRAGLDFLLLRCESGELDPAVGDWWNRFAEADFEGRDELMREPVPGTDSASPTRKRRRRRKPQGGRGDDTSVEVSADRGSHPESGNTPDTRSRSGGRARGASGSRDGKPS